MGQSPFCLNEHCKYLNHVQELLQVLRVQVITYQAIPPEQLLKDIMPTISMFFGIIIRMYFSPAEHPPPHFHVYYNEFKASVDIRNCEIIAGDLPKKQVKLVVAWAELHQEELLADWQLVMNGEEPFRIQPLQ